jgi:peptidyl-prolyl cis-trans isomerase D
MLSAVRKLLDNWIARGFFVLLIGVFIFWGISNVLTLVGSNTAVAHIGGNPVDITAVQAEYQTELNAAQQNNPNPDLATRQQIAAASLGEVLRQQAMRLEAKRLGVVVPDAAVRRVIYGIPAFQANGVFSETLFDQVLQQNSKTPDSFLAEVKDNLIGRQIILPVIGGAGPPKELTDQVFAFVAQQRFAETVAFPFAAQPTPPPPADAVLQRYWRNHPADFTAPEYRTVKMVILSPAVLAPNETISDSDVNAAYARATAGQQAVPLRSVQIITTDDEKKAASLANAWAATPDWTAMQAKAKAAGASPVELDNAQASQFPSTAMSAAVFVATPGAVTGPVTGPFGYFILKVTAVSDSLPNQATVKAQIRQALQLQKAQADVAQDVDNVQDALAGQTPLDKLPGNLGLTALQGTLEANGNTLDGTPAPIPGGADLKTAIVKAAFATSPGQPAQLTNGPNGSYFALSVDSITPPALKPFATVRAQVLAAWTTAQVQRAAEVKAATLLAAVNGGQSLDTAASAAGLATTMTPPVTRNAPPTGVPTVLAQALFSLKPGQVTMQQTDTGFTVAALANIVQPTPDQDASDYAQVQAAMVKGIQTDLASSFIAAMEGRDKVSVNQKMLAQIYQ